MNTMSFTLLFNELLIEIFGHLRPSMIYAREHSLDQVDEKMKLAVNSMSQLSLC